MSDSTPVIIESQLDYLTCAVHTSKAADRLQRLAEAWAKTTEEPTSEVIPWRLKGYEGWHCGRLSYGQRYGAAIVQLSGDLARQHFDTLSPIWDSVSRLDLAVTVRFPTYQPDLGPMHYREAQAWYDGHPRAARPSYHGDADGGYTLYLGERTSDRYLRCYNKQAEAAKDAAEAEHYARCWRYELETKGGTSHALARCLVQSDPQYRVDDVQASLWDYLNEHGILPTFARSGGRNLAGTFRRRSDRDTKLAWLQRTVKPTIEWLSQTGNIRDVYDRLGLSFDSAAGDSAQSAEGNNDVEDSGGPLDQSR